MPHIRPGPPATAPPPTAARLPITVDVVTLTVADGALRVLLVDRLLEPYAGRPALPDSFLLDGEEFPPYPLDFKVVVRDGVGTFTWLL